MRRAEPISREREASANPAPMTKKMAPEAASRRFRFSICHPPKRRRPAPESGTGLDGSIGELSRGRYDGPPALYFIGELFFERLGRRLIFRNGSGAELGKAFDDVIVLQRRLERGRKTIDNLLGRSLGGIKAVPDGDLDTGKARLGGGRHVGQIGQALLGGGGEGLDLARLDLIGGVGRLVAHEIDLAADEIGHGGAGAL